MDAEEGGKAEPEPEAGGSGRSAAAGVDMMEVEQGSQRCALLLPWPSSC